MKKIKYIICILFAMALTRCETEKLDIYNYGTISGVVLDADTYQPVVGAVISTTPPSISTLTNGEGKFEIGKIKEGDITINIKRQNYLANTVIVTVNKVEITKTDFLLYKDDNSIGTIKFYEPTPTNGAVEQAWALTLAWKIEGKKTNDELTYNIYIFESNSTVQHLLGEEVVLPEVTTSDLKSKTTYYWYVIAKHNGQKVACSPTWSFKTKE